MGNSDDTARIQGCKFHIIPVISEAVLGKRYHQITAHHICNYSEGLVYAELQVDADNVLDWQIAKQWVHAMLKGIVLELIMHF